MPEDTNKNTAAKSGETSPKADTSAKPTGSPVTPASESPKKDTSGDAASSHNGNAATNAAPGPQSTKSLVPGTASAPDNGQQPQHAASDNTVTDEGTASDPKASELSKEEEAELERILDNDDEQTNPDRAEVQKGQVPSAVTKLQRLVTRIPSDTPNEHVVWGAGGVTLNVGDLRELVKSIG